MRKPRFLCDNNLYSSFSFASSIAAFKATGSFRMWAKFAAVLGVNIGISKSVGSYLILAEAPISFFLSDERALSAEPARLARFTVGFLSSWLPDSADLSLLSVPL